MCKGTVFKYIAGISKPLCELTPKQTGFIGTEIEGKYDNVYKIVGVSEKPVSHNFYYIYECNVCSKDMELWPYGSIQCTKADLLRGRSPCGCGRNIKWTKRQYEILVQRECDKRGYIFHGWSGEYSQIDNTYIILSNPKTGNKWDSCTLNNFLKKKRGDPFAVGFKEDKYHIEDFINTGSYLKGTHFWKSERLTHSGDMSYWYYTCPKCSNDEYVQADVCNGVFESFIGDLKLGKKSCRCSKSYRWNQAQREYQITKICKEEGLVFLGWASEEGYKNNNSKINWSCKNNIKHKNIVVSSFLAGTRCTCCNENYGGFSKLKPAYFYVVRWYGYGESYIKCGITNRAVTDRVNEQYCRSQHLDYEILYKFYHESGALIQDLERTYKNNFPQAICPKDYLPDGYTETTYDTARDLEAILRLVNSHLK